MGTATDVRERLAREDPNFRRLSLKHAEHDKRLQELQAQKYLTREDQLEEVKLKKLKLALKDQMEEIVRRTTG